MSEHYEWRGGRELVLRFGAAYPIQVLILEPLFEEKNRTRWLITRMMRALEALGIGCALPDLPGTGESLMDGGQGSLDDWYDAARAACAVIQPVSIVSFRGGALLDNLGPPVWRFSPETGARIVRDMERTRVAGGQDGLFAGNKLSADFVAELREAVAASLPNSRTVRLESDAADADLKVAGSPLWRRAEPGEDPELAATLALDLAHWAKSCAAF